MATDCPNNLTPSSSLHVKKYVFLKLMIVEIYYFVIRAEESNAYHVFTMLTCDGVGIRLRLL